MLPQDKESQESPSWKRQAGSSPRASKGVRPCWHLYLRLWPPELWHNKFSCFKTHGSCYTVVAQTVKNLPAMWETRFDAWVGKTPEEGTGNPLQYSCLDNSMDRGIWGLQFMGSWRVTHLYLYIIWILPLFDFSFYWRIVDLQCFVSFRGIAQWFSYRYTYGLFQILFPDRLSQDTEYSSLCNIVGLFGYLCYVQ